MHSRKAPLGGGSVAAFDRVPVMTTEEQDEMIVKLQRKVRVSGVYWGRALAILSVILCGIQILLPEVFAPSFYAWMDSTTFWGVQVTSLCSYFLSGGVSVFKFHLLGRRSVALSLAALSLCPTLFVFLLKPGHAHAGESMHHFFFRNAVALGPAFFCAMCQYTAHLHTDLRSDLATLKKLRYTLKSA